MKCRTQANLTREGWEGGREREESEEKKGEKRKEEEKEEEKSEWGKGSFICPPKLTTTLPSIFEMPKEEDIPSEDILQIALYATTDFS
jgi:hypothetical protein